MRERERRRRSPLPTVAVRAVEKKRGDSPCAARRPRDGRANRAFPPSYLAVAEERREPAALRGAHERRGAQAVHVVLARAVVERHVAWEPKRVVEHALVVRASERETRGVGGVGGAAPSRGFRARERQRGWSCRPIASRRRCQCRPRRARLGLFGELLLVRQQRRARSCARVSRARGATQDARRAAACARATPRCVRPTPLPPIAPSCRRASRSCARRRERRCLCVRGRRPRRARVSRARRR